MSLRDTLTFVRSPFSPLRAEYIFRSLMKTQWQNPHETHSLQSKKLQALIYHCHDNVPFYNRIFKDLKLKPYNVRSVEDLQKLPVLTKAIIRKNLKTMIARNFPRKHMFLSSTGGSTGEPLKFFHDSLSMMWINAAVNRSFHWAGHRRFDKIVTVWGFPSHTQIPTKPWQRQMVISAFGADEKRIKQSLKSIEWFKPKGIRGYASALYLLAKYNENLNVNFVMSTSETLFKHYRKLIEEKFGCEVYDNYSSREFMIASECKAHSGFHVAAENCILEFVKDEEQVTPGEPGRILVTDLTRYGMPFLRYDIGDIGILSSEFCPCNRGLPLIKSIEGRTTDLIFTPSGMFIGSPAITLIFKDLDVKQYQVVQKSLRNLEIRVVKGSRFSDNDSDFILSQFRKCAPGMEVKVDFVDEIPVTRSGKRRVVVSKIQSENRKF